MTVSDETELSYLVFPEFNRDDLAYPATYTAVVLAFGKAAAEGDIASVRFAGTIDGGWETLANAYADILGLHNDKTVQTTIGRRLAKTSCDVGARGGGQVHDHDVEHVVLLLEPAERVGVDDAHPRRRERPAVQPRQLRLDQEDVLLALRLVVQLGLEHAHVALDDHDGLPEVVHDGAP